MLKEKKKKILTVQINNKKILNKSQLKVKLKKINFNHICSKTFITYKIKSFKSCKVNWYKFKTVYWNFNQTKS